VAGADQDNVWTVSGTDAVSLNGQTFTEVENLAGGAGEDTLVAADDDNVWVISGDNAGTLNAQSFTGVENLTGGAGNDTFVFAGGSLNGSVDGGAGNDTIVAADQDNVWRISGTNEGTLNDQSFTGIENLIGGAGADRFVFAGGSISGTVDGRGGINTFDYSSQAGGISVDLATGIATGAGSVANLSALIGSAGDDTLTGRDEDNVWTVGGTNAGSVGAVAFAEIENLSGGSASDKFVFDDVGALTGVIAGGLGEDSLQGADKPNTWIVSDADAGTLNDVAFVGIEDLFGGKDGDVFMVMAAGGLSGAIVGGEGADRIRGPERKTVWRFTGQGSGNAGGTRFTGIEDVQGGADEDTFGFDDAADFAGTVDGGGGTDSLDYAGWTSAVTVDLATGTATALLGFSGIEDVKGGEAADTLKGPVGDTTWTVSGPNSGDVAGVTFSSFEDLQGAADNEDTFVVKAAGSVSEKIEGGAGGYDVIVLDGGYFSSVAYDISGPDAGAIARDGNVIQYDGIEPLVDATVGPTRTFSGTAGKDHIVLTDRGTASDGSFAISIDTGEDVFFTDAGSITSLVINGLGGDDRIDVGVMWELDAGSTITVDAGGDDDEVAVQLAALDSDVTYSLSGGGGTHDTLLSSTSANAVLTDTALEGVTLSAFQRAVIFLSEGATLDADLFSGQVFVIHDLPNWSEEGPGAYTQILDGATAPWDPVSGAINSVAVDPNDRFTIYLGTVNGGVWRNTGSKEVFFDLNESTLTNDDKTTLNAFADFLEAHPELTVEVGGHTDSSGDAAANMTLSLARATSVRDYLVNTRHIDASRLRVVAYGEDRPVAENIAGVQPLNRRVELLVQNWEPLTDGFQSLSISSVAISPIASNVVYAGVGNTSSFRKAGGPEIGLLFSNDRGDNWQVLGSNELKGLTITQVLPTTLVTASGAQVVFVSTFDVDANSDSNLDDKGGLFRLEVKADGTLEKIEKISGAGTTSGLPAGHYTDLALDAGNGGARSVSVYAANPASGVFRFTDNGDGILDGTDAQWQLVNTGFQLGADSDGIGGDDLLQQATRIRMAIHPTTGTLYAGVIGPVESHGLFSLGASRTGLIGLFKTKDFGANWTSMTLPGSTDNGTVYGLNAGRQGDKHFAIVVDPTDEDIVYVAGDTQGTTTNNSAGLTNAGSGRVFAFDDLNTSWVQIVGNNADNTAPHADARGMVFVGNYTLLQINDGGLTRLQNPFNDTDQGTRRWTSLNQGLNINEVLGLAYDPINNDILIGAQDNGSAHQGAGSTDGIDNNNDGNVDEAGESAFWSGTGGDGNSQAAIPIDMTGDSVPDRVLRYSLHNNFNFLQAYEYTTAGVLIDAAGNPSNTFQNIGFRAPGNATALSGLNAQDAAIKFKPIPMVANSNDPTRMLIGYFGIYESVNTNIAPAGGQPRILPLDEIRQIDPAAAGAAVPKGSEVTALVYGGKVGNTRFDDVVLAARGDTVLYRAAAGQNLTPRTIPGAGTIRGLTVDPSNWKVVYAADSTDVYRIEDITDNAKTWVKLTGNLKAVGQQDIRALEYIEASTGDMLLVGGQGGVSRMRDPDAGTNPWVRVGRGLPNAPVTSIQFEDLIDPGHLNGGDKLIVGTLGRGVWSIKDPENALSLSQNSVLEILGATTADQFKLERDTDNPLLFNVFDLSQSATDPIFTARGSTFDQVQINTRGGDDTVTVDYGKGAVAVPRGIAIDGGSGESITSNTVILAGGARTSYTTGTTSGGLTFHDIVDLQGRTQRVLVENIANVDASGVAAALDNPFATVKGAVQSLLDVLTFA
ncbi:MAG TPA: OmpA family protein, partial [Vicinamibacterales bacterium]|nr:OmpA family protein [Vicinamibacterales bacterium]